MTDLKRYRLDCADGEWTPYDEAKAALLQARADAAATQALMVERAADDFAKDSNLNVRICCNGQDCGCQGATAADYVAYQLRALAPDAGTSELAKLRGERDAAVSKRNESERVLAGMTLELERLAAELAAQTAQETPDGL